MTRTDLLSKAFIVGAGLSMMMCNVESDTSSLEAEEQVLSQVFSGRVVDGAGTPIQGARVTINGISRITSSTGQYTVSIADSTTGYRLDVRKDTYAPLTELRLAGALSQVHRLQAGTTTTISNLSQGGQVRHPSGIVVNIPPNGLAPQSGAIAFPIRFTVIPHSSQTMPGDFTAQNSAGNRVALVSVGAVTLQAVDANGVTLGMAAGQTLAVNLPVPASAGGTMPACVLNGSCRTVMWRFNPATALWMEVPAAAPVFTAGGTQFGIRGPVKQGGLIDPADGLGTWNADIEFNNPACTVIEFSNIPLNCYNPLGATPEPGIEVSFTQALAGGGTKSKISNVASSAAFLVLYNLRPNVDIDLSFIFPPGAPANCAGNMTVTSTPAPNFGFPQVIAGGQKTQLSTGAAWGGSGYPNSTSTALPVDILDVINGTHPCNSTVTVTTF